jgi:adenosylcobyric acid synthase
MDWDKLTQRTTVACAGLPDAWRLLEGIGAEGYEIRNGRVTAQGCETEDARVWARGRVLATTVHGLLESPDVLHALVGVRPPPVLDATFEALADAIDAHLDTHLLWAMVRD